jgi:hypothetical protein
VIGRCKAGCNLRERCGCIEVLLFKGSESDSTQALEDVTIVWNLGAHALSVHHLLDRAAG